MKIRGKKSRRYGKGRCGLAVLSLLFMLAAGTMDVHAYENTVGIVKEGSGANIRLESSPDSELLASVRGGEKVEICGTEIGSDGYTWYKVYINGNTIGYVRSDLVTDTGEKTGGIADDDLKGGTVGGASGGEGAGGEATGGEVSGGDAGDGSGETEQPQEGEAGEGENPEQGQPEDGGQLPEQPQQPVPVMSSDAALYALSISGGTMTPAFSPSVTQYTIDVDENTTSISAFGVPASEDAKVSENYGFSNLVSGSNMAVITVQAADGTRLSYLFTINRGAPSEEIHYAVPSPVGSGQAQTGEIVQKAGSSHTVLLILLVIAILILAALLVMMGLRVRDYRRELYGEDAQEFHLRDALPAGSVFRRKKGAGGHFRERRASTRRGDDADEEVDEDEEADEDGEDADPDGYAYSVSDSMTISPASTASLAGAFGEAYDRTYAETQADSAQDGYFYNMKESGADEDGGFAYGAQEETDEEEPDEDEMEDIAEREATLNDRGNGKDVWKSVNFMTPSDDLEFEFLNLDENE